MAGSSLIADIVMDLLVDEGAEILTLASPTVPPEGDDLGSAPPAFAAEADLLLVHGFQADQHLFRRLVRSSGNWSLRMIIIQAPGSWQIPESQRMASELTATALAEAMPARAGIVRTRLARRLKALEALESEAGILAGSLRRCPVAASEMQAGFLAWAGLDVVWSFGGTRSQGGPPQRPPAGLAAELVADDLQTGGGAGEDVSRELGIPLAVLSSFPGTPEDSPDYFSLVRGNLRRLAEARHGPPPPEGVR
jgi:hypothetical protein